MFQCLCKERRRQKAKEWQNVCQNEREREEQRSRACVVLNISTQGKSIIFFVKILVLLFHFHTSTYSVYSKICLDNCKYTLLIYQQCNKVSRKQLKFAKIKLNKQEMTSPRHKIIKLCLSKRRLKRLFYVQILLL